MLGHGYPPSHPSADRPTRVQRHPGWTRAAAPQRVPWARRAGQWVSQRPCMLHRESGQVQWHFQQYSSSSVRASHNGGRRRPDASGAGSDVSGLTSEVTDDRFDVASCPKITRGGRTPGIVVRVRGRAAPGGCSRTRWQIETSPARATGAFARNLAENAERARDRARLVPRILGRSRTSPRIVGRPAGGRDRDDTPDFMDAYRQCMAQLAARIFAVLAHDVVTFGRGSASSSVYGWARRTLAPVHVTGRTADDAWFGICDGRGAAPPTTGADQHGQRKEGEPGVKPRSPASQMPRLHWGSWS
jgi:hypothetical protein